MFSKPHQDSERERDLGCTLNAKALLAGYQNRGSSNPLNLVLVGLRNSFGWKDLFIIVLKFTGTTLNILIFKEQTCLTELISFTVNEDLCFFHTKIRNKTFS